LHEEQEGRQKVDPWEDELRRCMKEGQISSLGVSVLWPKDQWISSADLLRVWLRVPPHLQSSTFSTRLGQVMRALNYTNESKTNEGKLARGWSPPPAEAVAPPQPPEYTSPTHQGEVLTEVYARSSDEEVPF
jgi:hypothetical protein